MITITKTLTAVLIMLNVSFANQSQYILTVSNPVNTSQNSVEFDIYLSCEGENNEFRYSYGQYFFEFNTEVSGGGNLTYTLIKSDLPEALRPRNAGVSGNLLRLAVNPPVNDKSIFPLVKSGTGKLLVARMKLESSSGKLSCNELNLKPAEGKFKTKIFSYQENQNIELKMAGNTFQETTQKGADNMTSSVTPGSFSLYQNYPNPFNPATKIRFDIPENSREDVKLLVYDISGRMVSSLINGRLNPGTYEVIFSGNGLASGMYFYTLKAGKFSQTMRMVLIK